MESAFIGISDEKARDEERISSFPDHAMGHRKDRISGRTYHPNLSLNQQSKTG